MSGPFCFHQGYKFVFRTKQHIKLIKLDKRSSGEKSEVGKCTRVSLELYLNIMIIKQYEDLALNILFPPLICSSTGSAHTKRTA